MKPRSPITFIAIFTVIHFVPGHSEEDLEVSRTIEPVVLQRLESQFLKMFGMEKRPVKQKSSIKIPRYLVDLYKSQTGLDLPTSNLHLPGRHTKTANTVRTFYPASSKLFFDLSSIPPAEEVTGAEIRIPINRTEILKNYQHKNPGSREAPLLKVRVIINDLIKFIGKEPIMYPVDSKYVDLSKRKSEVFSLTLDVFPAVHRWMNSKQKSNKGFIVQIFEAVEGKDIKWTWDPTNYDESPTLFTYSDDGSHHRRTRDAKTLSRVYRSAVNERKNRNKKHRNKNRKRNLCSRKAMFVDFQDVGWNDWIVAPPGYDAFFCSGECPYPMADHLNATNHAVIQALVNSMNPQQVPPPCCVPTKYKSINLLYNDAADKVVLKVYEEMAVEACGCS